ncbi:MAG: ribbon-helix-helix domain-containing protein [Pseudomonadota bacterium]
MEIPDDQEIPDDHTAPPNAAASDEASARYSAPTRPLKRSFSIAGHRTSISLETAFWEALREIAASKERSVASLVAEIDRDRGDAGLSGAIRAYVLDYYRTRAASHRDGSAVG